MMKMFFSILFFVGTFSYAQAASVAPLQQKLAGLRDSMGMLKEKLKSFSEKLKLLSMNLEVSKDSGLAGIVKYFAKELEAPNQAWMDKNKTSMQEKNLLMKQYADLGSAIEKTIMKVSKASDFSIIEEAGEKKYQVASLNFKMKAETFDLKYKPLISFLKEREAKIQKLVEGDDVGFLTLQYLIDNLERASVAFLTSVWLVVSPIVDDIKLYEIVVSRCFNTYSTEVGIRLDELLQKNLVGEMLDRCLVLKAIAVIHEKEVNKLIKKIDNEKEQGLQITGDKKDVLKREKIAEALIQSINDIKKKTEETFSEEAPVDPEKDFKEAKEAYNKCFWLGEDLECAFETLKIGEEDFLNPSGGTLRMYPGYSKAKEVYKKLSLANHPDKRGGLSEEFDKINKAWKTLERSYYHKYQGFDANAPDSVNLSLELFIEKAEACLVPGGNSWSADSAFKTFYLNDFKDMLDSSLMDNEKALKFFGLQGKVVDSYLCMTFIKKYEKLRYILDNIKDFLEKHLVLQGGSQEKLYSVVLNILNVACDCLINDGCKEYALIDPLKAIGIDTSSIEPATDDFFIKVVKKYDTKLKEAGDDSERGIINQAFEMLFRGYFRKVTEATVIASDVDCGRILKDFKIRKCFAGLSIEFDEKNASIDYFIEIIKGYCVEHFNLSKTNHFAKWSLSEAAKVFVLQYLSSRCDEGMTDDVAFLLFGMKKTGAKWEEIEKKKNVLGNNINDLCSFSFLQKIFSSSTWATKIGEDVKANISFFRLSANILLNKAFNHLKDGSFKVSSAS